MLTDLPDDILFLICEHLLPLEIVLIRQTCKSLLAVTSKKFTWIKAISRICERDAIYTSSFRTADLELPQLQAIATGPERWTRMLQSSRDSDCAESEMLLLKPVNVRQLSPTLFHLSQWPSRIFLIPGGRFLLTMTGPTVAVWDLDASSIQRPMATATHPISVSMFTNSWRIISQISADGRKLRVILYLPLASNPYLYHYAIYEISPTDEFPTFQAIAQLQVKSQVDLDFTSVWGDRLVFIYGAVLKVWNFATDEWATWRVATPPSQILMLKDSITLVYSGYLTIWGIPELTPGARRQALLPEPTEISNPRYTKPFALSTDNTLSRTWCNGLDDFFTGTHQPLWFDFSRPGLLILDRFLFEPHPDPDHKGENEEPLTPLMEIEYKYGGQQGLVVSAGRPCFGGIYTLWHDELGIYCEGASMTDAEPKSYHAKIQLPSGYEHIDVNRTKTTFCPVSGRVCCLIRAAAEHDDDGPGPIIQIFDFLTPVPSGENITE